MTIEEVEATIAEMKSRPEFHTICMQYDALLDVIDSVADNDIIALVLVAEELSKKENIDAT
jgi:predicted peptidase